MSKTIALPDPPPQTKPKRTMSAAARRAISRAQKARWRLKRITPSGPKEKNTNHQESKGRRADDKPRGRFTILCFTDTAESAAEIATAIMTTDATTNVSISQH